MSEEKADEIGIKGFAYKPIEKADLARWVRRVLDHRLPMGNGEHILLIDDDKSLLKSYRLILTGLGCRSIHITMPLKR